MNLELKDTFVIDVYTESEDYAIVEAFACVNYECKFFVADDKPRGMFESDLTGKYKDCIFDEVEFKNIKKLKEIELTEWCAEHDKQRLIAVVDKINRTKWEEFRIIYVNGYFAFECKLNTRWRFLYNPSLSGVEILLDDLKECGYYNE